MTGFTNAGFETGDFTGWSTGGNFFYVQSATKSEGSYGACAICESDGYPVSQGFGMFQTLDLTDIDEINYDINITNFAGGYPGVCYIEVSIDGTGVATYTATTNGWTTATIDTTSYNGNCEVNIQGVCPVPDW